MKKKQRTVSKFVRLLVAIFFLSTCWLYGQDARTVLGRADSLFLQKQYTQSFALYKGLFDENIYTESALLKMAFIQEGLGQVIQSLYYLNLYYLVSGDDRAFQKLTKMADQNSFQGYEPDAFMQVRYLLYRNYLSLAIVLGALILILLSLLFYQKRKHRRISPLVFTTLLICLTLLFVHINFDKKINRGVVATDTAYFMEAPSAGAPVIDRIGKGNQVAVTGKQDVWLRVQWMDREAYVKQNQMLLIEP